MNHSALKIILIASVFFQILLMIIFYTLMVLPMLKVEFFDLKGTLVLKSYLDQKNKKINTAHLNKGVYFLKIKNTKSLNQ